MKALCAFNRCWESFERARVQRDLLESEREASKNRNLIEAITNTMSNPVFAKDKERRIVFANKATLDIAKRNADNIIGKTDEKWQGNSEFTKQAKLNDELVLKTGVAHTFEESFRGSDGAVRVFAGTKTPWRDESGEIIGLVGGFTDITEFKNLERDLRESERRHKVAFSAGSFGLWDWDLETDEVYADKLLKGLWDFELELESFPVNRFFERIHEDDIPAVCTALTAALEDRGDFNAEFRVLLPDGSQRWMSSYGDTIEDESGKVSRFIGVSQDITEQKETELKLAAESERKTRFLATLSHELRNPLAPVQNAFSLLEIDTLPEDKKKLIVETGRRSADHLTRLVDDLLDITRITRGKIEITREVVDLIPILRDAITEVKEKIEEKSHKFESCCKEAQIFIHADAARIRQILSNVLSNAAKYTPPQGILKLECRVVNEMAEITIDDTGPGIPKEMLKDVFEIFTQVQRPLDRSEDGLGIGLALVKELVEKHGGFVKAMNRPEKGLRMVIKLPVVNQ